MGRPGRRAGVAAHRRRDQRDPAQHDRRARPRPAAGAALRQGQAVQRDVPRARMNFELSDEQLMLRDAAAGALSRIDTGAGARDALDGGELPGIWSSARQAGWTGLLVPEVHGGAGLTALDAML